MIKQAPSEQEIHSISGLRGLAAVWVMLCHCWYFLGTPAMSVLGLDLAKLFAMGWIGVMVFFVLSGFLLARPFVDWRLYGAAKPDTFRYLVRRILRVFPAYYAQLLVLFAISWFYSGTLLMSSLYALLAHLTMFFNVGFHPIAPVVGVWWTLPVEFCFYLLLPLLAYGMGPTFKAMLVLALGLGISLLYHALAWQGFHDREIGEWASFLNQAPGYLFAFVFGVAASCYWRDATRAFARHPRLSAMLSGLALAGGVYLLYLMPAAEDSARFWHEPGFYYLWKPAMGLVITGVILSCADQRAHLSALLGTWPLRYLGDISYSLYLWHLPVIGAVNTLWPSPHLANPLRWFVVFFTAILIAQASTWVVERPMIRLARRLTAR